jgi:hypothetical protein
MIPPPKYSNQPAGYNVDDQKTSVASSTNTTMKRKWAQEVMRIEKE